MHCLALDIGGANLKIADGQGFAATRFFPLWKDPAGLSAALAKLLAAAPPAPRLVVTMTGELADCYRTKAEGVASIIDAVSGVAQDRDVQIYLTDGTFVSPEVALDRPLAAAASNWHALASLAGRFAGQGRALLIDVGSTTSDLIPLVDGQPTPQGHTDPERLVAGELVYTGVVRSPICAVTDTLPWRDCRCPVAHEVFATTLDAYLITGDLPEDTEETVTADGRPATREFALDRLARQICADRTMFDSHDARSAAQAVRTAQLAQLGIAANGVVARMSGPPETVIVSGQGEFLARRLVKRLGWPASVVSLTEQLGPKVSRCATAHALAVLGNSLKKSGSGPIFGETP